MSEKQPLFSRYLALLSDGEGNHYDPPLVYSDQEVYNANLNKEIRLGHIIPTREELAQYICELDQFAEEKELKTDLDGISDSIKQTNQAIYEKNLNSLRHVANHQKYAATKEYIRKLVKEIKISGSIGGVEIHTSRVMHLVDMACKKNLNSLVENFLSAKDENESAVLNDIKDILLLNR